MTEGRRARDYFMLISPERVFYAGLLGRPRRRISGGINFYASLHGKIRIVQAGSDRICDAAVIPAYTAHSIESDFPAIVCLVVEPETVEPGATNRLISSICETGGTAFAERVRVAYHILRQQHPRDGFTSDEFDRLLFGHGLPERRVDRRISTATLLNDFSGTRMSATECADIANLSRSRLLHLFKDETGVPFREFRAWKRARHLLHFVNEDLNLAHLAQDMGYPDSTHFSHSIRRFYGLKPRAIFSGSRELSIHRSSSMPAALPVGMSSY